MVEYTLNFDAVFGALSDPTRRDLLVRVLKEDLTISELAGRYALTFAGVAKHVDVLLKARLVNKRRQGREQVVSGNGAAVRETTALLQAFEALWSARFDRLEEFLEQEE
jgi:DNA-binding transcriptional ArsR family regulator